MCDKGMLVRLWFWWGGSSCVFGVVGDNVLIEKSGNVLFLGDKMLFLRVYLSPAGRVPPSDLISPRIFFFSRRHTSKSFFQRQVLKEPSIVLALECLFDIN